MNESQKVEGFPLDFFLMTITVSWLIWLPGVLDSMNIIALQLSNRIYGLLNLLGGFGPTITAFVLLYRQEGRNAVKDLILRTFNYRDIGKMWWIPLFLLLPAIGLGALLLNMISGGTVPELSLLMQPWLILIYFIGSLLPFANPIREEFGWRGYALNQLQRRWDAFSSSIFLGIGWGIWHLPLFIFPTSEEIYGNVPIWIFIGNTILVSCFMTWLNNNTNGSMLTAILFHAVANLSGLIFPLHLTEFGLYYDLLLKMIFVAIVVSIFGHKKMVRKYNQN